MLDNDYIVSLDLLQDRGGVSRGNPWIFDENTDETLLLSSSEINRLVQKDPKYDPPKLQPITYFLELF